MHFDRRSCSALAICLLIALATVLPSYAKEKWREITPSELSMKKGKVDPDADAEAIFWEVRINDSNTDLVMEHYIRLKILTDRGREKFSKVDIPYVKGIRIKNIEARVVKPDGSEFNLTDDDVFDREIIKSDDVKVKAKSFAVPGIEVGVILEYKYKEVHTHGSADNMRMVFQRDVPMEDVVYYYKPFSSARYLTFNLDKQKFEKDKGGFYRLERTNVPALKEEPMMPPEDEVRSWLLIYYYPRALLDKDDLSFWSFVGYYMAKDYEIKDTLKPGKKLKAAAKEITAGATTEQEKLRKLFDFCKTKVHNIDFDTSLSDDEKDDIKLNGDDDKTYKKLQGRSFEIDKLFASLADAAGFDTRIAFTGDRSKLFFNPGRAHPSFVHMAGVAVKLGNRWRYFDPGSPFLPYGKLAWYEENTSAFLLAYKDYITIETPMSGYDESEEIRKADLELTDDGTLQGTVTLQYTGHFSYRQKMKNYDVSVNQQEEFLKDKLKGRLNGVEVSDISIENVTDPEKPFTYKFKIKVPNYAQKTGKRIFLQPGFFQYGTDAMFTSSARKYDVYFQFPWSESDEVSIKLPDNYSLDNPDSPAPIEDSGGISSLSITMRIDPKDNRLIFKRRFFFGGRRKILFPARSYGAVKNLWDLIHKADTHVLTLKRNEEQ